MASRKLLRVVELYGGTGRSSDPFRAWRRASISLLVDNNPYAAEVYKANYSSTPYLVTDLGKCSSSELERSAGGRIDILLGCPPCQGFSDVGSRQSDDPRNSHMSRFARFVRELRPKAVALENVPLAANSIRFARFVRSLEEGGYNWTAGIANAALYGSCQSRQRLILVAIRKDAGAAPRIPKPSHGGVLKYFNYSKRMLTTISADPVAMLGIAPASQRARKLQLDDSICALGATAIPTVGEVLEGLPSIGSKSADSLGHFVWEHSVRILRRMGGVVEGGRWKGASRYYSQTYGRLHRRGLSRTLTTFFPNAGSGRFWHPTENRAISLREAARIQGFPDSFSFLSNNSMNCILVGNALDGALAELKYRAIREALDS